MTGVLLALCVAVVIAVRPPWKSAEGRKLVHRLHDPHVSLKNLKSPAGIVIFLQHAGEAFSSEASFPHIVPLGLWWGAAAGAGLSVALLLSLPLWTRPATTRHIRLIPSHLPRGAIVLLLLIVLASGWLRWQRINGELLRDEEDTLCRNVWGKHVETQDGATVFVGNPWARTLFENGGANNPVLFSVSARVCNSIWQTLSGAGPEWFSRAAVRFPSFLAALGAIAAIAVLGWRLGDGKAGLAAAALLAVHPWHIRYSVEGRGYSMAIFFALACWFWFVTALRSGRWRDWILFAASQLLLLYSFTGAIYLAFVQTVAALALTPIVRPGGGHWRFQWMRLLTACAFSAVVYFLLMMPSAPQILYYLHKPTTFGTVTTPEWLSEALGALVGGVNLGVYQGAPPPEFAPVWDLRMLPTQNPALFALIVISLALSAIGVIRLLRRDAVAAALTLTLILSPLLSYAHNAFTGHYLYPWYLIYGLPAHVLFMGWGLRAIPSALLVPPRLKTPAFAAFAAGFVVFFVAVLPKGFYRANDGAMGQPYELLRGSNVFVIYPEGKILQKYTANQQKSAP